MDAQSVWEVFIAVAIVRQIFRARDIFSSW